MKLSYEFRPFFLIPAVLGLAVLTACDDALVSTHSTSTATSTVTVNGKTVYSSGGKLEINGTTVTLNGKTVSEGTVQGKGPARAETRDLAAFTGVELRTIANVEIKFGEKHRCTITADENLLPLIKTEIVGGTLQLIPGESYSSSNPVSISIEMPVIQKACLMGSGSMTLRDVAAEALNLEISGSGNITASGTAKSLSAIVSGAGDIRAQELQIEKGVVRILGAGNADVWVENELEAEVNGAGNISYRGAVTQVKSSVRGAGSIKKR